MVGLEHTNYTVMEGYRVEICLSVQGDLTGVEEVTFVKVADTVTAMG